ncbi:MAG: DNA-3-methyladenine glycosylase I [Polyangiaceae bacterium]|nr:DNA-3-methyladenine glycosylase I [Polyangiaceae bacterium]
MKERKRCLWARKDPLYLPYHDEEWGVPSHDDVHLFEMLILEGAQAGLSWITILRKREGYRRAFSGFDPSRVARFDEAKRARLLEDQTIVRNRAKIDSAISNAKAFLQVKKEHGSFASYLWSWVDGRPIQGRYAEQSAVPVKTDLAERISKDLMRRGFRFVGPTIVYSYMQAVGLVNDHISGCFRRREVAKLS